MHTYINYSLEQIIFAQINLLYSIYVHVYMLMRP